MGGNGNAECARNIGASETAGGVSVVCLLLASTVVFFFMVGP